MEAKAIAKMQRISPIKARLVIDLIRGKNALEARNILVNYNNKAAGLIKNVLDSAIANAVNNNKMDEKILYVKEARVDAGPVMKRMMFDSRGHVGRKDKRTSHIVITVAEKEAKVATKKAEKKTEDKVEVKETKKVVKKAAPKKATKKTTKEEK